MITNREVLKEYLHCDQIALGRKNEVRPRWGRDEIWHFQRLLRYTEYYYNTRKSIVSKILYIWYKFRFHKLSVKLGFSIPLNVFGKGLSIAHYGPIVVNDKAKIGEFCRIQESVTIGSTGGSWKAPQIGDYVFIASGARIIGDIQIGSYNAIGANAVVTKSFLEEHITLAGIPAQKISNNDSSNFIRKE